MRVCERSSGKQETNPANLFQPTQLSTFRLTIRGKGIQDHFVRTISWKDMISLTYHMIIPDLKEKRLMEECPNSILGKKNTKPLFLFVKRIIYRFSIRSEERR